MKFPFILVLLTAGGAYIAVSCDVCDHGMLAVIECKWLRPALCLRQGLDGPLAYRSHTSR